MDETKRFIRRDQTYWADHVVRWRESGLTQTEYCRQRSLNPRSLSNWNRKLANTPTDASFVEVSGSRNFIESGSGIMELSVDKIRIRIREEVHPLVLREIIAVLRGIDNAASA